MSAAERALGRRLLGSALGVAGGGVLFAVVARAALGWMGIEVPAPWLVGASLAVFAALEIGVRRETRVRRAPAVALADALVGPLGGVLSSRGGLPLIRVDEAVVGFEPEGGVLRVVIVLSVPAPLVLWAGVRGDAVADVMAKRLAGQGFEEVPGAPPKTLVLAPDGPSARTFVRQVGEMLSRLCSRPGVALELAGDVRWSAPVEGLPPAEVVGALATLRALAVEEEHG